MSSQMAMRDLFRFLSVVNSHLRVEQLLPAVLDLSISLSGADRGFVLVYDSRGHLSIKSSRDKQKLDLKEEDFQGSTSIINKALEQKKVLYVPKMEETEFSISESIRKWNLQSAICLPLRHGTDRIEGVLYLDSASVVNLLSDEHLQMMQALANYVAICIANTKLFQEVEDQKQKITQLNSELQKRVDLQAGNIAEMKILLAETQRELGKVYGLGSIIGRSKAMLKVYKVLEKVVRTNATILILGESGTGKELIARYIHYNGSRAEKPMVSVNCSAFSEALLESELFGHRKGAFTGATENKMGLFELADDGTLFLDEVGDMSAEMQKKLLRVLQDGEIRPIGSKETQKVDVRIIAATNKNLKDMIQAGTFREDLYFRLNVIMIQLVPLRDRPEDIPLLIDYFTNRISEELNRPLKPPGGEILKRFLEYDWPGNIRELENELRRVFILETEYELELLQSAEEENDDDDINLGTLEKKAILKALEAANGNKTKAAEMLGVPRRTFYKKLIKYNIY
jgi:transcriptional regulator with GAF, ATPase, and Fis domain